MFPWLWRRGFNPWRNSNAPAANTQATATQAAAGAGRRNVCVGIQAVIAGGVAAPSAAQVDVRLIDGASGGAAILWEVQLAIIGTAGAIQGISTGTIYIEGAVNTAMTLEFSAAGGANTFESVNFQGYIVAD